MQKDAKQRLRDIGDARISLDEVLSGAPEGASSVAAAGRPAKQWRLWAISGVAAVLLLATAILAFLYFGQKPNAGRAMRFQIPAPEKATQGGFFALSPDGRKLAFLATGLDGQLRVWVRSLETLEARPLDGTEGATAFLFWSPDSRFIAFQALTKLKKIEAAGGPPLTLCDVTGLLLGGTWNRDDKIVFGSPTGLQTVSASGGAPSKVTTGGVAVGPFFLPDGRHLIYLRPPGPEWTEKTGIYLGSVDAKPEEQPSKKLLPDTTTVYYAPSSDPGVGYLLFVRGGTPANGNLGTLMAQRFDNRRLELSGEAVPIVEQVSIVGFSASATDVLVYVTGSANIMTTQGTRGNIRGQLTWFDRDGKTLGSFGDPGVYRTMALSPDGKYVAFERADFQNPASRNIWVYEFARGVTTRFTFGSDRFDSYPLWSPDGSRIAFTSSRGGAFDLYQKTSNLAGEDELLFRSGDAKAPTSWSPDGRFIVYFNPVAPARLWLLPLAGGAADRKAVRIDNSEFNEASGRISPDGRWLAYSSDESGRGEVYVRPLVTSSATGTSAASGESVTGKWMVSKDGGGTPLWRRDGKELFFLSRDGQAMAVDVNTAGVFKAGTPKALFKVPAGVIFWDVSADGKRFIMTAPSAATAQPPFTVVLNWQSLLR